MATDPAESTSRPRSTYGFLLRPKWIAFSLLVVLMVVVMINLAFWQLRRLDERRQFNAEVIANTHQPIVPYEDITSKLTDPSAIEWRPVRVSGTYLPGHQFLVVNRSQDGDTGRNVVDPLQLADGSLLLINRGFVPITDPVPQLPSGSVTVDGQLRVSEHRATGQPADQNVAGLTEIHRIDVGLLAGQFDTAVQPMYVEQVVSRPADATVLQPIAPPDTSDEGPHLSYTIQWFIFSGCVIAGWVLVVRRSAAQRSGKVVKKRRSGYVPFADDESVS
jgi:cytochrome oxidase assembly protein ShyY1